MTDCERYSEIDARFNDHLVLSNSEVAFMVTHEAECSRHGGQHFTSQAHDPRIHDSLVPVIKRARSVLARLGEERSAHEAFFNLEEFTRGLSIQDCLARLQRVAKLCDVLQTETIPVSHRQDVILYLRLLLVWCKMWEKTSASSSAQSSMLESLIRKLVAEGKLAT